MRKRLIKKKRAILERSVPGGSLIYVPAGQKQGILGQTFYGSTSNIPVGATTSFSPGTPLAPQPGMNPLGQPQSFKYPVAYNTFPPNRSLYEEMPTFEQLRRIAVMDYGTGLCERYWLDMVPQMKLKVGLKQEYITAGAEEKQYQKELTYFKNFFSKPDGQHNIHEWIQQALVEQSQIDELYIYKNRTRGGKLLGLPIVAGDQMKPLLDDWGRQPDKYAYQQYPWGIPGWQYTADQMIHRRETPSVNTPYGRSRVERVLLITNTALRKQKQDLAHFTEGNIPAGIMQVPESLNWTPDQIDAYEQSWNSLVAGNLQQMVRVKFTQPGMEYVPFVQPSLDSVIDRYWLNIRASVYGVPMDELGFTETSNRSVGEIQQDVVYRRTIGPHAITYAMILTDIMNNDFPPELHGEMFEVTFGGYEEQEDDQAKAATLTMYTNAGVLGLTNAAKAANLPEDPGAPHIGRVFMSKDGPIFLDDMASDTVRKAALDAKMAGFEMAANPPEPGESQNPDGNEKNTSNDEKKPPQSGNKSAKPGKSDDEEQPVSRVVEALARIDEQLRLLRAVNVTPGTQMVSQQGTYTCDICTGNHGQVVESAPPYHDGCDCTMVPKGEEREPRAFKDTEDETRVSANPERTTRSIARAGSQPESVRDAAPGIDRARAISQEYRRWRERAIADAKAHRAQRPFVSTLIPDEEYTAIWEALRTSLVPSVEDVRAVFERARERDASPKALAASASNNGGNQGQSKRDWKLRW